MNACTSIAQSYFVHMEITGGEDDHILEIFNIFIIILVCMKKKIQRIKRLTAGNSKRWYLRGGKKKVISGSK